MLALSLLQTLSIFISCILKFYSKVYTKLENPHLRSHRPL